MSEFLGPYEVGPNETEENGIYVGDAEKLGQEIPNDSVDFIMCDPVYTNYGQYYWLSHFAERVLKPGKSVLAQVGSLHRHRAEEVFYWWPPCGKMKLEPRILLFERLTGGHTQVWKPRALAYLKTYLWFAKPGPKQKGWIPELVTGGGRRKRRHVWGDSTQAAETWISRFTEPGEVVVDPFCGSGMVQIACIRTGRRYLGFEINPERVKNARVDCTRAQPSMIHSGHQLEIPMPEHE